MSMFLFFSLLSRPHKASYEDKSGTVKGIYAALVAVAQDTPYVGTDDKERALVSSMGIFFLNSKKT